MRNGINMGFNPKKELNKIKASLKSKGYVKDIPVDVFGVEIMIVIGTGKKKAIEWVENFQMMNLIKKDGNVINFMEK